MIIETKFNHGQRVQAIVYSTEEYKEKCSFCDGLGYFIHKDEKIACAKYWTNGFILKTKNKRWYVPIEDTNWYNFVIQKIGVELYNPNNKKVSNNKSWIYYMTESLGNMFAEKDLFASIEEAQEECDRRNKLEILDE
jgi:excinuclease UvrABC ATPase subunit